MFTVKNHMLHRAADGTAIPYSRTPNRGGRIAPSDMRAIVVHDTAGRLGNGSSASWLCNPAARASAHLVVDRDGGVVQLAEFNVKTWHAGRSRYRNLVGLNSYSIGIEMENPGRLSKVRNGPLDSYKSSFKKVYRGRGVEGSFDIEHVVNETHGDHYWMDYTEEQVHVVEGICLALSSEYGIKTVVGHFEISPGRKIDPNPLFPLDQLKAKLIGREAAPKQNPVLNDFDGNTTANVNMRRWPNTIHDNRICVIKRNAPVVIVRSGVQEDGYRWHLCKVEDATGWIRGDFIHLFD